MKQHTENTENTESTGNMKHSPLFNTFHCLDLGMDADIIFNLLGSIIAHDLSENEKEKNTFITPAISHALEKCKQAQQEYKEVKEERGQIIQDYPEAFKPESLNDVFWKGKEERKAIFKAKIKDNQKKRDTATKNIEQSYIALVVSLLEEKLKAKKVSTANTANNENYVCSVDTIEEMAKNNSLLSVLKKDSPYMIELFTNPLDNLAFYIHDVLVFLHYEQDIVVYENEEEKSVIDSEILLEPLSEKQIKTVEKLLNNVSRWWI